MHTCTLLIMTALAMGSAGCAGEETLAPDATPAQGSPARGDLVINEVAPGAAIDWIELANRSAEPVDLCDFFVTDGLDRLDHYSPLSGVMPPEPCEPVLLDAGAYLIVPADDSTTPGHARFKLGTADAVYVVTTAGLAMDSLVYLHARPGLTLARVPDSQGLFYPATPTPGAANPESPEEL